jgi:hypothetical protein
MLFFVHLRKKMPKEVQAAEKPKTRSKAKARIIPVTREYTINLHKSVFGV